jgi:hypothetical protein
MSQQRKNKMKVYQQVTRSYSDFVWVMRRRDILDRAVNNPAQVTEEDIQQIRQLLQTNPELMDVVLSNPQLTSVLVVRPNEEAPAVEAPVTSDFIPAVPALPVAVAPEIAPPANVEASIVDEYYTLEDVLPNIRWSNNRGSNLARGGGKKQEYETMTIDLSSIPELEQNGKVSRVGAADFDNQRTAMQLHRLKESTMVVGIVIDQEDTQNECQAIPCNNGVAFGGYAHDLSRDAYLVRCVTALYLGSVPFSFLMSYVGIGNWKVKVPICIDVLMRSFSFAQNKKLEELRTRYPSRRYRIEFMQMINCN